MENTNDKNKAAEAAALLKEKKAALKALPETATADEKAIAEKEVADAQLVVDEIKKASKPEKAKTVKVKALEHLSGKYGLAWSAGQEFECEEKQAKELVANKDAEYLK